MHTVQHCIHVLPVGIPAFCKGVFHAESNKTPSCIKLALVRAGFGLFHLLLYFEELVLKYHDQYPYNNQLAAVQSQNKQACIKMIKPGSVVYWEVTLFLNYIVRVWPLSLMLLNNLQWFSVTISNKVNATQWICLKMEPLHTENRVAQSKNPALDMFLIHSCHLQTSCPSTCGQNIPEKRHIFS